MSDDPVRAFVAVALPGPVRDALAREQDGLRGELPGARWTRPDGIHLTLHFLGDILPPEVEQLGRELRAAAAAFSPFEIEVGGLGVFPGPRRPRVLWTDVRGAPDELQALYQATAAALVRCGLPVERRRFRPHLTLARFRQRPSRQSLSTLGHILGSERGQAGSFEVDAVHLYRSELLPSGARYTVLHEAPFGA